MHQRKELIQVLVLVEGGRRDREGGRKRKSGMKGHKESQASIEGK
jgi:hypothetical protein